MANVANDLYALLPAIYRERDAHQNYPLRALLGILGAQGALVDADIQQQYENLFIETCQDWVIPYIGDLVSNKLLYDATRITQPDTAKSLLPNLIGRDLLPPVAARIRSDVAKTIYYRRRKSTPAMLEELARDVTGWAARLVEFFQLLGWTQNLEHLRDECVWTDLRSDDKMQLVYGPFDGCSHTVDVRPPCQQAGWHNIHNIGFFLWRLQAFPLEKVPARPVTVPWQCHFSPLGNPARLFSRLHPEVEGARLVTEYDVSAPVRRNLFFDDLQDYENTALPLPATKLYGEFSVVPGDPASSSTTSMFVWVNGQPVDPANPTSPPNTVVPQIFCARLDHWPATQPRGKVVGIDVVNGRLAVGDGWGPVTSVNVSYWYGFSSGLGGGGYDRRKWLIDPNSFAPPATVYRVQQSGAGGAFTTLSAALTQWQTDAPKSAVISILDGRTYTLPLTIAIPNGSTLAIEAASMSRPLLQTSTVGEVLNIDVSGIVPTNDERNACFTLSGVVLEGFLHVIGDLGELRFIHSTLIPGRQLDPATGNPLYANDPSLVVEPAAAGKQINSQFQLEAAFSIIGQLSVPDTAQQIWLLDCVVQGAVNGSTQVAVCGPNQQFAATLYTERSTFLGAVLVHSLQASESIFTSAVNSDRTQEGCARFCYIPLTLPKNLPPLLKVKTPRRFECQPDLGIAEAIAEALKSNPNLTATQKKQISSDVQAWLVPAFTSTTYGQPAFAQLSLSCPNEIRTGSEDGSEMGAFSHLKQPQRASNLAIRLQEYLPFGLEPAIVYVT